MPRRLLKPWRVKFVLCKSVRALRGPGGAANDFCHEDVLQDSYMVVIGKHFTCLLIVVYWEIPT